MALVSAAHLQENETGYAGVPFEKIEQHHAGLICLTGGPEGPVNRLLKPKNQSRLKRIWPA